MFLISLSMKFQDRLLDILKVKLNIELGNLMILYLIDDSSDEDQKEENQEDNSDQYSSINQESEHQPENDPEQNQVFL